MLTASASVDETHTVDCSTHQTLIVYQKSDRLAKYIFNKDVVKFEYLSKDLKYQCKLQISKGDPALNGTIYKIQFAENDSDLRDIRTRRAYAESVTLTATKCYKYFIWQWKCSSIFYGRFADMAEFIYDDLRKLPQHAVQIYIW
jgi:hypothetical protein